MFVTLLHAHLKPEPMQAFIKATHGKCQHPVCEAGHLRFEVLQSSDEQAHVVLDVADARDAEAGRDLEWRVRWPTGWPPDGLASDSMAGIPR